jgi:hypothetical protein
VKVFRNMAKVSSKGKGGAVIEVMVNERAQRQLQVVPSTWHKFTTPMGGRLLQVAPYTRVCYVHSQQYRYNTTSVEATKLHLDKKPGNSTINKT